MPQPIVYQKDQGLIQGILGGSQALASGIGQYQENKKLEQERQRQSAEQQKQNTILGNVLSQFSPDATPMQKAQLIMGSQLSPENKKIAFSIIEPELKETAKVQAASAERRNISNSLFNQDNYEGELKVKTPQGNIGENEIAQLISSPFESNRKLGEHYQKQLEKEEKKVTDLWNYKPNQKFLENVETEAKEAEFGNQIADEIIKIAPTANPKDIRTFLASRYGENLPFLFTPESASLKLLEKYQAKGLRQIFQRPTQAEFFFINSAQAQLGKTPEANVAVANLQKKFNNIPIRVANITDQVIKENGGVPPRDLAAKVRNKSKTIQEENTIDAAAITYKYGTGDDKQKAYEYLKEKNSPLVRGGQQSEKKPITRSDMLKFKSLSGGNVEEAKRLAEKEGYDINRIVNE